MSRSRYRRRDVLELLLAFAGAATVPLPLGCRTACAGRREAPPRTFDRREWSVVEAACSRLIPSDDGQAGAREANVVGYIDLQLAQPHFAVFKQEFEAGASALELVSAAMFGNRFLEVAPGQQDQVLSAVQSGEGSAAGFSAEHFFQVLHTFTLEGFLSDPVHGGNRNEVGWKVIGYAPGHPRPAS